jgi:hypothetical protein
MSEFDRTARRRNGDLIDSAEELASGVGRLGYGLLSFGIELLPPQSRGHMRNAIRELSYAFAELPRSFAEIAGEPIEEWAAASDDAFATAPAGATTAARRVRIYEAPGDGEPLGAAPAVAAGVTIEHIEYNPPGADLLGEYVRISNRGPEPVALTGWTLSDGHARHSYTFPAFTLAPGASVQLWTKAGLDDMANLYWGQRSPVWNNDGDSGFLRDAAGVIVASHTYVGDTGT